MTRIRHAAVALAERRWIGNHGAMSGTGRRDACGGMAVRCIRRVAILLGGVTATVCICALGADLRPLDSFLADAAQEIGPCALSLSQHGVTIYEKAVGGFALDQPLPIYSATKWLSAAVMACLADDALLSMDDPVARYFPALDLGDVVMTIRHLFAHTSGLPDSVPDGICTDSMTLQGCAEILSNLPVLTQPGRVFAYGEVSMQIGGALAEIAGDALWHDLFTSYLAAPLGMLATDYEAFGASTNPVIGGGARSTVHDYLRFLTMLVSGGTASGTRVLSEESVAMILARQTLGAVGAPENGYGLGCWRERVDVVSDAALVASSPGANGFTPWVDLGRGLVGVLAVDGDGALVYPVFQRLLALIEELLPVRQD